MSPVSRSSPKGTPAALPYPILSRLSSTSQSARRRAPAGCRGSPGGTHEPGGRRGARAAGGAAPKDRL